jgi:hypothetical protein
MQEFNYKKFKAFENFLRSQVAYIDESKWYEGEKRKCDPGQAFIFEWVEKNAPEFRRRWEVSVCKECDLGHKCGNLLKTKCTEFKEL